MIKKIITKIGIKYLVGGFLAITITIGGVVYATVIKDGKENAEVNHAVVADYGNKGEDANTVVAEVAPATTNTETTPVDKPVEEVKPVETSAPVSQPVVEEKTSETKTTESKTTTSNTKTSSTTNTTKNTTTQNPTNPTPSNPAPTNPTPSNPTPSNPTPTNPTPSNPTPSYTAYTSFSYNINSEGSYGVYLEKNEASMYSAYLSNRATLSSFNNETLKGATALAGGAYIDKVKAKYTNKLYNNKYLITGVDVNKYKVYCKKDSGLQLKDNEIWEEAKKQGADGNPGGLFSSAISYTKIDGDYDYMYVYKITVKFKEI